MAVLRLFASVRVAAGTGKVDIPGNTVGDVLAAADEKFGQGFAGMAATYTPRRWPSPGPVTVAG